jgi:hypothetical protein
MFQRVAQPPINPTARDPERRDFWPGFVLALIGALVIFVGAKHLTDVDTTDGDSARETQLVKAFSSGGLELVDTVPPPGPAVFDDPARAAAAIEQWERSSARPARLKFRVNTGASTPCPT